MTQLYVAYAGVTHKIEQDDTCVFGRSRRCTVRLDPADLGVARIAGAFMFKGAHWLLRHYDGQAGSPGPPLSLVDHRGNRNLLQDGRVHVIERDVTVLVQGEVRDYMLNVSLTAPIDSASAPPPDDDEQPTRWPDPQQLSVDDRLALAAVFAEHLDERIANPARVQVAVAAARLNCSERALARRLERIMERLDQTGVGGMTGPTRLDALGQYVIPRVIGPDDLHRLKSRLRAAAYHPDSSPADS